jgi:hypothetical protein
MDSEGRVENDRWAVLMDEAWSRFGDSPPSRLKVQISDLPGEAEEREKWIKDEADKSGFRPYVELIVQRSGRGS